MTSGWQQCCARMNSRDPGTSTTDEDPDQACGRRACHIRALEQKGMSDRAGGTSPGNDRGPIGLPDCRQGRRIIREPETVLGGRQNAPRSSSGGHSCAVSVQLVASAEASFDLHVNDVGPAAAGSMGGRSACRGRSDDSDQQDSQAVPFGRDTPVRDRSVAFAPSPGHRQRGGGARMAHSHSWPVVAVLTRPGALPSR